MKPIESALARKVTDHLAACTGCHACLRACPVAPEGLKIADLNAATAAAEQLDSAPVAVQRFVWECFQCGMCVPVCPVGLERDAMVLWQKASAPERPPGVNRVLHLHGPTDGMGERLGVMLHNLRQRSGMQALATHVDKARLRPADTLFYFGCNIFSDTGTPAKVLALADYLGTDYEVLGGLRSCCGWSHMLAGELDRADAAMDHLLGRIKSAAAKEVVAIGAECYTALKRLAALNDDCFTPVTIASWIRRNLHRFPVQRTTDTLTFHDACHVSCKQHEGEEARRVLRQFGHLVEMPAHGDSAMCCGFHQFEYNPEQLISQRNARLRMARRTGAGTMVVECVRCLESFAPLASAHDIEVVDLVDLAYNAVQDDDDSLTQPVHFDSLVADRRKGVIPAEGS